MWPASSGFLLNFSIRIEKIQKEAINLYFYMNRSPKDRAIINLETP